MIGLVNWSNSVCISREVVAGVLLIVGQCLEGRQNVCRERPSWLQGRPHDNPRPVHVRHLPPLERDLPALHLLFGGAQLVCPFSFISFILE
jgi:hypothetical protein